MIRSFRCADTERLFNRRFTKRFSGIERIARRKLEMIHAATGLNDLGAVPGSKLKALRGNRKGQHSIRINEQWRVCFVWRKGGAHGVEIVDYH